MRWHECRVVTEKWIPMPCTLETLFLLKIVQGQLSQQTENLEMDPKCTELLVCQVNQLNWFTWHTFATNSLLGAVIRVKMGTKTWEKCVCLGNTPIDNYYQHQGPNVLTKYQSRVHQPGFQHKSRSHLSPSLLTFAVQSKQRREKVKPHKLHLRCMKTFVNLSSPPPPQIQGVTNEPSLFVLQVHMIM